MPAKEKVAVMPPQIRYELMIYVLERLIETNPPDIEILQVVLEKWKLKCQSLRSKSTQPSAKLLSMDIQ